MSKTNEDTKTPRGNFRGKHTGNQGYQPMNHWVVCDSCGFDIRAKDIRETWDHRMVCPSDWEPRHPQDFVRSKHDRIGAEEPVRPPPQDLFISTCGLGITSVSSMAVCSESVCNDACGRAIPGGGIPAGTFTNTL